DAHRYADDHREQHREASELGRDREVLLHDVVHALVAQHERRSEVETGDSDDVALVLDVPRLVETELVVEVRQHRRRHRLVALTERAALDRAHHPERHEDDEEDDRNRPEDATDDELQHGASLALSEKRVGPRKAGPNPSIDSASRRSLW